jgi:hypothetical protein
MGSSRYGVACGGGIGTQTATLAIGGYIAPAVVATVESWNGSSWSPSPSINTARMNAGVAGTQTSALIFGGRFPDKNNTESWNGTSWTSLNNMNTARWAIGCFGTQTAAIGTSGEPPTNATESWNGTSWTTVAASNTTIAGRSGAGIQTLGLAFGGDGTSATELWNGTSWTNNPTGLANARAHAGANGTQASALAFGGYLPAGGGTNTNLTEEWTGTETSNRTVTVS